MPRRARIHSTRGTPALQERADEGDTWTHLNDPSEPPKGHRNDGGKNADAPKKTFLYNLSINLCIIIRAVATPAGALVRVRAAALVHVLGSAEGRLARVRLGVGLGF